MTRFKLFASVLAAALALPFAATAQDQPGFFKIPGTDTTIRFNGFAEMTYFYEFSGQTDVAGNGEFYNTPGSVLLDGDPLTNRAPNSLGFEAVYSRFGFLTNTPSSVGNIGVRIEGDFNHNIQLAGGTFTNKGDLRVRHAYGTVGDVLLLGQTWTTFADLGSFPDQQDENPVPNLSALRAPMVRVTLPAGPTKLSIAAENPYFTNLAGHYYVIPDFILKLDIPAAGVGSFSIRALTREFKNAAHSAQGFGAAVGAAIKVGGDTLVLDGEVGVGMGPYMVSTFPDAVDIVTDIKMFTTFGGSAGFTHVWSPEFRSNLIFAILAASENSDIQAFDPVAYAAVNKTVVTGAFNTYWAVARNFWVGVEFWYNWRKTFGDVKGKEFRGELTSHFDFF